MTLPSIVRDHYAGILPRLERVQQDVQALLRPYCRERGLLFDDRVKGVDSFAEKVETARFPTLDRIDDLYAAMIVVSTSNEHDKALEFLEGSFESVRVARRYSARKSPEVFRFDGTRFYGRLSYPEGLRDIVFEIQVATMFEFAWSRTTHSLTYKSDEMDWRRARASAMLKALAEQADMVVQSFDDVAGLLSSSSWPAIDDKQLIASFISARLDEGKIPAELAPQSITRFSDNVYKLIRTLSGSRSAQHDSDRCLDDLTKALQLVDDYVDANSGDRFPRSVTLLQVILGVLATSNEFQNDVKATDYHPPLSRELFDLFPDVADREWPSASPLT